jgi:hypothetical protein
VGWVGALLSKGQEQEGLSWVAACKESVAYLSGFCMCFLSEAGLMSVQTSLM